jgi:hypothetical protein
LFVEQQKYTQQRGIVIDIVQCGNDFGNTLNENILRQPFVMGNGESGLYYLVSEVSEELEYFIRTGKRPEKDRGTNREYHVFPQEQEALMVNRWTELGMAVTYSRQQVELACRITITYMKVQNPETNLSISLIPWVVVAGRPYPIFVYVYAIGYYQRAEKKSLEEAALAVRKLFGISDFHKSTVSRSLSAMEGFVDASRLDQPLVADDMKKPGDETMCHNYETIIVHVSEILTAYPSNESLKRDIGEKIKHLPGPIRRAGGISYALSGIPDEQFEIIIHGEPDKRRPPDRRVRPQRPRNKKPVQRALEFVAYPQREDKRRAFVAICRQMVLDAAIRHHRFLV